MASLEIALTPEQLATLDEPSTPSLGFPATINAGQGPMLGFGGAKVDGVELPVWPICSPAQPATESAPEPTIASSVTDQTNR